MSFEKIFIGKGTQVPNLPITRVTIPFDKLEAIAYEREGVKYVTFEISKMKTPDKFGRDYTCFYSKKVTNTVNEPAKKKGRRKKQQEENLPF